MKGILVPGILVMVQYGGAGWPGLVVWQHECQGCQHGRPATRGVSRAASRHATSGPPDVTTSLTTVGRARFTLFSSELPLVLDPTLLLQMLGSDGGS